MRSGEDWNAHTREEAERAIGYHFQNKALLKRCFTHSSYSNVRGEESNERLEFLGDAVLGLCISEMLFSNEQTGDEGALTDLRKEYVSQEALTESEKKLDLMRFLRYSGSEENVGGKTPSNLFEAVIAGIYLDGGLEETRKFIKKFALRVKITDYISLLKVYLEKHKADPSKVYDEREENGKHICTAAALGKSASATGENPKAARKEAAKKLYQILSARERS